MYSVMASILIPMLALVGGVAPTARHTPGPKPHASIIVQPETVDLHPGESQQLTAVLSSGRGKPGGSGTVRWSTSAESTATVSPTGLVLAVAPGTATITASSKGATGTSIVTVTPVAPNEPPTVTITGPAEGTTYASGSNVTFEATATDPEDGILTSSIAWSAGDAQLGTGGEVSTSSLAPGSHVVTASVTDTGGTTTTDTVTITVLAPDRAPTVSITGPVDGAEVYGSQAFAVTATASDPEDGDLTAGLVWSIESASGTTPAGTGATITLGPLPLGTYTVTASVTDTGGLTGTAQITVHVVQEPVVVTVAPDGVAMNESVPLSFTASVTGAVTGTSYPEFDDAATWTLTSSDGTPQDVGTGATVEVGPLTPGAYTIAATVDVDGGQAPAVDQLTFDVADCVVTGSLRPATGLYIPQTLALSATQSTDSCGRSLRYFWECESDTIPYCAAFMTAANADGNTHSMTAIEINTFDEIAITLTVCAVDATYDPTSTAPSGDCAPSIINVYRGAVAS